MTGSSAPDPEPGTGPRAAPGPLDVLQRAVAAERDLLVLRRDVQVACRSLGMGETDTVRMATVVSEVGRDLLGAAGLIGRLTVDRVGERPMVVAEFGWTGALRPADATLDAARRLLYRTRRVEQPFPRVLLGQPLPGTSEQMEGRVVAARGELRALSRVSVGEELRSQNHELLQALQEARAHQEELQRLNEELERTNQGVMALYAELSNELETTNSGVVALHAELEEKSRQLGLVNEAKTRFWANVSHELRSPINDVIGLTRLLLAPGADALTEEQHQQVAMIAASGSTLLALVEELLDVAKAESGRLEPELVPVDLRMLLHQLRGTLGGTARPGVSLVIPADDFDAPFTTDEVMLTRILRNVLSNSLKFTERGEVRLTVERQDRADGPWYVFTVSDTGIGIPAEEQSRVFEEFYQVRGPHQKARSGTGLGLPYARRLTSLLDGRMTLSSAAGAGTQVSVEIPAGFAQAPATVADTAILTGEPGVARVPDGAVAEGGALRLRSLVVVDDDPVFLASVRPVLGRLASVVTEVGDSADAVSTIRRLRPDAVLLDLSMPPPDGYQLLAQLAGDPALARLPVVVLTASDRSELDRTRLAHAQAVLGKTHLSTSRLADVLAPALGRATPPSPRQPRDHDPGGPGHPGAPGHGSEGASRA